MSEFNPRYDSGSNLEVWWKQPKDSQALSDAVAATVETLQGEQVYLGQRMKRAISLYENIDVSNLVAWQFSTVTDKDGPYDYNVIEQVIDTLLSEIITNRTRPQFITEGGDWVATQQAQDLTDFSDGMFSDAKIHEEVAPAVCLDALVFGTGIAKVWAEGGKICASRIFPADIVVDDLCAALSPPRTIYHMKIASRDAVLAQFGTTKKLIQTIEDVPGFDSIAIASRGATKDLIAIREAWRLPSAGGIPGRHVITLDGGAVLHDEEWHHNWFPFVFLRYKQRTKGFWGKGVAEILEGHQELINDMRDKINAQLALSAPMMWHQIGARYKEADFGNDLMRVIESEVAPQIIVSPSVPTDLMNRLAQEVSDAGSLVGANTLMMKSELPPGLNSGSGRALRIYNDTKSKRFMRFSRDYETFHIDLCRAMISVADAAVDDEEQEIEAVYSADTFIKRKKYNDIRLPKGSYVIKPQPVNFLSDTPSGRLSDIEALAQIFPEELKPKLASLMADPDIKSATSYLNADEDAIGKACSSILRGDKTSAEVAPTPYLNLDLAIALSRTIYLQAQTQGAPPERLVELENWMQMVVELQQRAAPPQQEMATQTATAAVGGQQ